MDIPFDTLSKDARYKLLTALVVPRPIAWITSLGAGGLTNAAPFSFFNVLGNDPPIVAFAPSDRADGSLKDTARNIEETKEFVVNLVDLEVAPQMHASAAPFPAHVSELEALGIVTEPSVSVRPPRIKASKVHLECKHWGTVMVENNRVVFGVVAHLHVADGLVNPENHRVDPNGFLGVGRLQGPGWYASTEERFDLGRYPDPAVLLGKNGG